METNLNNFYDSVIIHFSGEIWLKKTWTRKYYEKRLARNLKQTLKHYNVPYNKLVRRHSRFYLKTTSSLEAADKLVRVFGISSVSPAVETTSKLDDVIKKCLYLASIIMGQGDSFAVKCKRSGNHDFSSNDILKKVGKQVLDKYGRDLNLKVDLDRPDVVLGVEIRDNQAFVYSQTLEAVGGMPLGVQPRLVSLFSGGIDSAVGSWLVMKRGSPLILVYFDNNPFTDETVTRRALNVAKILFSWSIGYPRKIYVIQHGENLKQIMQTKRKYSCLLCKRMMYRVAERLAEQFHAEGIVTGEAIGEQASQTLTNLRVLSEAVKEYPIHRPLLGFDKHETEAIGRKIGTYKPSSVKAGSCGAVPYQPSTKARIEDVLKAEENLPIEAMIEQSLNSIKIIEL
ncbi:tRNA 4-thiouridine(8) synthase ThiI [Candidatus Bathyarchaeota archaeon]|nr:tRNA 4-thiouridine(8) synthase ThiI [Candidatus Bathyarchaeota archaeon]